MSDLIQSVTEGKIDSTTSTSSSSSSTKSSSSLDKDSFLQLLCTQMQYQDPLNPSSNTEYVAQLATFSQLEQMQNIATSTATSQAFSLVGKNVTVTAENATGNTTSINGTVDFVSVTKGVAKLSINGSLYSIDDLAGVTDETYIKEQNSPGVDTAASLTYDADNPKNLSFIADMGNGDYAADDVAIVINGTKIDSSLVDVTKGKVTVDKSALSNLANGSYKVTVAFNNADYTTVTDKVTLQVKNSEVTETSSDSTDAVTT